MKSPLDLWEDIGSLGEEELFHVITKLFALYETALEQNPGNPAARQFFNHLESVVNQTRECNSNRR